MQNTGKGKRHIEKMKTKMCKTSQRYIWRISWLRRCTVRDLQYQRCWKFRRSLVLVGNSSVGNIKCKTGKKTCFDWKGVFRGCSFILIVVTWEINTSILIFQLLKEDLKPERRGLATKYWNYGYFCTVTICSALELHLSSLQRLST